MKKLLVLLLSAALAAGVLAGCGSSEPETQETAAAPEESAGEEPEEAADAEEAAEGESSGEEGLKAALVVAGGFGDRSFYDSSKEGADRLVADYGVELSTIECNGENFEAKTRNAADANEIVILVGWEFYDVETIAPQYPDVKFIWIDNATGAPVDNILNIVYAQNEGSFLAGYAAAGMSKSGVVGAVGGEDSDTINDFITGYEHGVEYYNSEKGTDVKAVKSYCNSYDDPAAGKDSAIDLNDKGADVVFQIASAAGDGVFEAAEERGFYAIGVDSDQKFINDAVIICSMKKEVGNSIYDAVTEYINGDSSKWGTTWIADMTNGYIGLGYGDENATQQIPDELKAEIEELSGKIASGEIKVNSTRS